MKKILSFALFLSLTCITKAQLLVSDSTFNSFNNGVTYSLVSVDSTFHAPGNCRQAYMYSKVFNIATQQLTNNTYVTYDYFPDGNLRQTVVQTWNPGTQSYANASKTTLTYTATGSKLLTSLTEVAVGASNWRNQSLQTNTYNGSNYLTLSVYQSWNTTTSAWVTEQQTDYYNRANGLADSAITKEYNNNVVIHQAKDIYSYVGATSAVYRVVNQTRVNNQWQDSTRSTYTYNASNKITVVDIEAYSPATQAWDLVSKSTFAYNAAGDLITLTQNIFVQGFALITQTRYKPVPCNTSSTTPGELCPSGNSTLSAGSTGASYQWQVNTGGGFANISNNANYSGATTATLSLTNIPSTWYGYQYRCVVAGVNGAPITLKFVSTWTGATNSQWEVGSNWSCGAVPDANTDVIINTGGTAILNSNRSVRSITLNNGAKLTVNTGFKLTITK